MDRDLSTAIRVAGLAVADSLRASGKMMAEAIRLYAAVKARSEGVSPASAALWLKEVDEQKRVC